MKYQVDKGIVQHEGTLYHRGSFFDAEPTDVLHLVGKFISPADVSSQPEMIVHPNVESVQTASEGRLSTDILGGVPASEDAELPTPDAFRAMKAPEQKELLQELGIHPESSAEARQEQYADYYEHADEEL